MLFGLCFLLLVWSCMDTVLSLKRIRAERLEARVAARLWRTP